MRPRVVDLLLENLRTVLASSVAIAVFILIETIIPLRRREHWHRAHLAPNLHLTLITLAIGVVLNTAVVVWLSWLDAHDLALLRRLAVPTWASTAIAIVALDLAYYALHVTMHRVPALWRIHRVHHSDPVVDVTTTMRQHPAEGLLRYATIFVSVSLLGVGVTAFAAYRVWSIVNGLVEHANVRMPRWLDRAISVVSVSPDMHRVHHSRVQQETDSNFGNIFSWFDRAFATFTPGRRGRSVRCGLAGFDGPAAQTTTGLLRMPFDDRVPSDDAARRAS